MARAELRAAVTGAQPKKSRTRKSTAGQTSGSGDPEKDLNNPKVQDEILRPKVISFIAAGKTIIMPLEYTIEDVLDRGVFEDVFAFASQVGVEIERLSPELATLGFHDLMTQYPGYLEAALLRSPVRQRVRELLMRIAHYVERRDGKDMKLRPILSDLEEMDPRDYLVCAMRLYIDAFKRRDNAKNAARTASG